MKTLSAAIWTPLPICDENANTNFSSIPRARARSVQIVRLVRNRTCGAKRRYGITNLAVADVGRRDFEKARFMMDDLKPRLSHPGLAGLFVLPSHSLNLHLWSKAALAYPNRSPSVHKSGMGSKRLDDIAAYRRHGYKLQVQCAKCGRTKIYDPDTLITLCHARGWSRMMGQLEARFRCTDCGGRNVKCGPVMGLGWWAGLIDLAGARYGYRKRLK